jgi:hypothetical protein
MSSQYDHADRVATSAVVEQPLAGVTRVLTVILYTRG